MTRKSPKVAKKRRESDWRLFLRLVPYARRQGPLLAMSMLLLVPLSLAGAVQPLIVGQAVSLIKNEPTWAIIAGRTLSSGLNILGVLLLGTIAIRLFFLGYQGYIVQKIGQQITADIRDDLFDHVTSLAVRFFDRTPVGKLITRLTSDVEALGQVFSTGAIGIVNDIFAIIAIIIIMFLQQWQLASLLVIMLLPVTGLIIYFQHQYRQANYQAREELSGLNSQLQENIVGIDVVHLFRREQFNGELFRRTNQQYIKQIDKTIFHDSAISATLEWISLAAIGGVLWMGSILVMQSNLKFGTLAEFILFAPRLFDPLRRFAEKFTMFQAGFTAIERISDIMDEPIEIRDPEVVHPVQHPTASKNKTGEIRFENVWFAYKGDEYVLKNLNFTIHPGEKVALVGPTAAGKSSIIRLLCRLYEATHGRILVDGIDIRDLRQAALRRHLGVILQDGFLFAGDIKSNISLGENYDLAEIQKAAQITDVAGFIEKLPQGYDTQLRQRGTNISSGQKQLLAFARVAIRDPRILVLDEATANLDVGTEALIQQALDQLLVGRTAIIIAHRLSTIRNVDRILVLKRGELIESGSHEQLLQLNGLYASLYKLQMLGN
ncbi:MAG: ABC transporter ATP-binding protein [Hormoscilla sp.]